MPFHLLILCKFFLFKEFVLIKYIIEAFFFFFKFQIILVCCGQRDTTGLTAENNELKLRLQTMEQQVHLQDGKVFISLFLPAACLVANFFS